MTSRDNPSAAFWATVLGVAAVAYPISFGPACWIAARTQPPGPYLGDRIVTPVRGATRLFYLPVIAAGSMTNEECRHPPPIRAAFERYINLGCPRGLHLGLREGEVRCGKPFCGWWLLL